MVIIKRPKKRINLVDKVDQVNDEIEKIEQHI